MRLLCTFPGKVGDLLWALPTMRAIAEHYDTPVTLQLPYTLEAISGLVTMQPYIADVYLDLDWVTRDTAPISPRTPPWLLANEEGHASQHLLRYTETDPHGYDRVIHLGYEGWPSLPLPYDTLRRGIQQTDNAPLTLDLSRPWIVAPMRLSTDIAIGFTDEWFELKYGITQLLITYVVHQPIGRERHWVNVSHSPRWDTEGRSICLASDWGDAASWISGAQVFLGCCSALHVLAVALGTPVVCMEPHSDRHNPVFWPLGAPQVQKVIGGDGRWTFDARATIALVEEQLR
jgi:ADP-heptose:LPS heptosyltransferase